MLRVLFLHRDLHFHGGVPKCILYFAQSCPRDRIDVRVGCFKFPSAEMVKAFGELDIVPHCLGDNGYSAPIGRLRRIMIDENIDIVVCNSFKSYVAAKLANLGLGRRTIFWVHAIKAMLEGTARQVVYNALLRTDPIVFVSEAVKRAHMPKLHHGPTAVIYNGVNDPWAEQAHRPYPRTVCRELGVPENALLICYVAEFITWKDHATLLRAFDQIDMSRHNAHLLLIGTGQNYEAIAALAAKLKHPERIHFLGPRSDARRIVGMVDMYAHPSKGEGFGLAVVEAMLAERPVIVAREGACIEYIRHGQTGMIFRPGDSADLAHQINALAADADLRKRMGRAARQYCLENFPMRRFVERVCGVLERDMPSPRNEPSSKRTEYAL